jgi:hypothetical protein
MNFRNFYLRVAKLSLFTTILLVMSGCSYINYALNGFEEEELPQYVVGFHLPSGSSRSAALIKQTDESIDGEILQVPLNKISVLDSKLISDINCFPDGIDGYMLVLTLDRHARLRWQGYSAKFNGQRLAVVVDGEIVGWWNVETLRNQEDPVEVFCHLDKELAENIASHAKNNHKLLNKKTWNIGWARHTD